MSKIEDLAEKFFPKKEHVAFGPLPCEEPNVIDDNQPYRIGFIAGYKEAEKDNELTWENMFDIFRLVNVVLDDYADGKTRKEVGEEVLRRFKDLKHVKQKI